MSNRFQEHAFPAAGCGERALEGAVPTRACCLYLSPDAPPVDDGVIAAGFYNSHVHFTEPKWEDAAVKPAAELPQPGTVEAALADETHRRGPPVLAQPTEIERIELAIEASVDVLVHTTIGDGRTVSDAALVEQLAAEDVALTTAPAARWPGGAAGRIAEGEAADLVVLAADLAADPPNFANVRCTIRGGHLLFLGASP